MTPRLLPARLLGALVLGAVPALAATAHAQDVSGGAPTSQGTSSEADADDFPSVLVVALRDTPDTLVYDVESFLGEACQVVDSSD